MSQLVEKNIKNITYQTFFAGQDVEDRFAFVCYCERTAGWRILDFIQGQAHGIGNCGVQIGWFYGGIYGGQQPVTPVKSPVESGGFSGVFTGGRWPG